MNITRREWQNYTQRLKGLSDRAARLIEEYIAKNSLSDMDALIRYAVLVCDKYSEAAGALSAEMYDETVAAENKFRPPADPVLPPSYGEVAKAMNGVHKHSMNPAEYGGAVGRLVKRTGADTSLMNALRDGAEFAWVPNGDTCAFCMTLASNGWQRMSKKALKNGHAEHIHPNCDCTYAIRVDGKSSVEGYDPEEYRRLYYGAEGDTPQARINYMRRQQYAAEPEKYRAKARMAYLERSHKGANRESEIARSIIDSADYSRRISRIDGSRAVTNAIASEGRRMLKHRSGTLYEDLTFVSLDTGEYITRTDYDAVRAVVPSDKMIQFIARSEPYRTICVHNHPGSTVPSAADIKAIKARKNAYGVVLCHNGRIYKYSRRGAFNEAAYDAAVAKLDKTKYTKNDISAFVREVESAGALIEII